MLFEGNHGRKVFTSSSAKSRCSAAMSCTPKRRSTSLSVSSRIPSITRPPEGSCRAGAASSQRPAFAPAAGRPCAPVFILPDAARNFHPSLAALYSKAGAYFASICYAMVFEQFIK